VIPSKNKKKLKNDIRVPNIIPATAAAYPRASSGELDFEENRVAILLIN
jgi:hypothetical protein